MYCSADLAQCARITGHIHMWIGATVRRGMGGKGRRHRHWLVPVSWRATGDSLLGTGRESRPTGRAISVAVHRKSTTTGSRRRRSKVITRLEAIGRRRVLLRSKSHVRVRTPLTRIGGMRAGVGLESRRPSRLRAAASAVVAFQGMG